MTSCFTVFFALFVVTSAGAQETAWWVRATFEPRDETVEGIPVAKLDPDWVKASALSEADLPEGAQEEGWRLTDVGFALSLEADLDGDGVRERVVVGVYRHRSGATGRFLLVLGRKPRGTSWVKRALFSNEGDPGFSAVGFFEGRLLWVTCLICDSGCEVQYRWWRLRLKCYSCC